MNTNVDFETSKSLKEKGFDNESAYYYNEKGEILFDINFPSLRHTKPNIYYDSPTITEVVMWLYEKHGIWIYVRNFETLPFCSYILQSGEPMVAFNNDNKGFNSPTEAYQEAIIYTLNNLI